MNTVPCLASGLSAQVFRGRDAIRHRAAGEILPPVVYVTAIERTTAGINKLEGRHDERANQVREYVAAGLSDDGDGQPLGLRGWNGQET